MRSSLPRLPIQLDTAVTPTSALTCSMLASPSPSCYAPSVDRVNSLKINLSAISPPCMSSVHPPLDEASPMARAAAETAPAEPAVQSACLSEDDDENIKATKTSMSTPKSQRTPTPKMTRCTPKPSRPTHSRSRHSQGSNLSANDEAFPDTMQPIKEETNQLTVYKRPKDDVTDNEAEDDHESELDDNDDDAEEEDLSEDSDVEKHETSEDAAMEKAVLGRFGYTKLKTITATLQGHIFVASKESKRSKSSNKEKQVVIKKTLKSLHSEHVTVQNGRKFGIYENILKECIILKHLTEHRAGLIMTSFTKYDCFFDNARAYYLSMEHGGADLFDFIISAHQLIASKQLKIKEWRKFSKYLFWQMIVVTHWLHSDMRTCHLDISLENLLIKNATFVPIESDDGDESGSEDGNGSKQQFTVNSNVQIKLCDFGLAEVFESDDFECAKFCGKTNYKAPEVYAKEGSFDARKADVWSLGVVLFCMLVGSPPYNKPSESDQAYLYVKNGIIDQLLFQWERNHFITLKVLDLLHKMLCFESDERVLVEEVLRHPWLALYFNKYKAQMLKKSMVQKAKQKQMVQKRLPYYRLPVERASTTASMLNISQ